MKTQIKRLSKSTLAVILTICLLISCMTVGIIATDAAKTTEERVGAFDNSESVGAGQYNKWWGGTIYFRVPDQWDLTTYPAIRLVIRRTTDGTVSDYNVTRSMTVVGNASYSRLYKIDLSSNAIDHQKWKQYEYIAFFACQSGYTDEGAYALTNTGIGHYTRALDYGTNDKSYYMFRPSTETSCTTTTTNNPIEAEYKASEADAMKYNTGTHYAYAYTDGSSSATGGSTTINAYWLDGTTPKNSTNTNSPTASYGSMMEGCKVTVNATENTGYSFDGWYSDSALTTLVSSSAEYSYYSYNTKSLYASFVANASHTVTATLADSTISTWSDDTTANKTVSGSGAITLPIVKSVGDHKFVNWTTSSSGATITNADKNDGTATVTVDNDNAVVTANFADSTTFMRYSTNPSDATSFVDVAIDTTEGATLRYTTAQSTFGYLFIDKSDANNYKYFKTNGSETLPVPSGGSPNTNASTSFWARTDAYYAGKNMSPSTGSDFSINLPAGVYQVRYVAEYTETTGGNTLEYNFWKDSDIETEYYVAGMYEDGTANFFGTAWDPGLSANKMTSNGAGTYTKRFTSNIAGGTIMFKVVVNGDWDEGSYPSSGNQTQVIYSNSTWVQFDFNSSTGAITVTQDGSSGTATGWLYSGTAPASRTVVDPTSGMDALSNHTSHDAFRFMYGTTDTGLTTPLTPTLYYDGTGGNAYWAELTEAMSSKSKFFFGLCNYSDKGNLVGNNSEEINDAAQDDGTDVKITDTSGNTLFKIQRKQNNDVSSRAKYVLIYDVDWTKVSAIGVKAWDNSQSTNSSNSHTGKVDYQIYYKGKSGSDDDDDEVTLVDIYAKNGELRDSTFNRFTNLANTDIVGFSYTASNGTTYNSVSWLLFFQVGKSGCQLGFCDCL